MVIFALCRLLRANHIFNIIPPQAAVSVRRVKREDFLVGEDFGPHIFDYMYTYRRLDMVSTGQESVKDVPDAKRSGTRVLGLWRCMKFFEPSLTLRHRATCNPRLYFVIYITSLLHALSSSQDAETSLKWGRTPRVFWIRDATLRPGLLRRNLQVIVYRPWCRAAPESSSCVCVYLSSERNGFGCGP